MSLVNSPRENGLIVVDDATRARLTSAGVSTSGAVRRLLPETVFETPCVIHADIRRYHRVTIGAFTGIFGGTIGHSNIGRFCSIAPGVDIASDQHPTDWLSTSMVQYVHNVHGWGDFLARRGHAPHAALRPSFNANAEVTIGNDVWIGAGVFMKSGVTIGHRAFVAAHSVVVKDVPAYHIVGGNPARTIRPRFPEAIVERLLKLEWWNFDVFAVKGLDPSRTEAAAEALTTPKHARCSGRSRRASSMRPISKTRAPRTTNKRRCATGGGKGTR